MNETVQWILLVVLAFLPPIIYAVWIRNTERYQRQQWLSIFLCFLWGATIAVVAAVILEVVLEIPLALSQQNEAMTSLLIVVIIAPVVEEFTKPLALSLRSVKKEINEYEDGLIYGAIAGLGFSATENLLYGWSFLSEGFVMFLVLMGIRSFGGCLLHASATALTGYGYGKALLKQKTLLRVIPYLAIAIIVHGTYNFLLTYNLPGLLSGFFLAMLFVVIMIGFVRKKIRALDQQPTTPPSL